MVWVVRFNLKYFEFDPYESYGSNELRWPSWSNGSTWPLKFQSSLNSCAFEFDYGLKMNQLNLSKDLNQIWWSESNEFI